MVKAVLRERRVGVARVAAPRRAHTIAFAYLVTVLLFARSGLYAERAQRPGLRGSSPRCSRSTVVALIFALVNGEDYSSYYIFYGTLVFAVVIIGSARWGYERLTGALLRAAGYRRRAVLVGSGRHIEDVAHALTDEVHAPVEMVGFISLTPRPDNGLRSLGRIEDVAEVLDVYRVQEVIIADPDFPQERAVELVDTCHQRGVTVRVAPSTMEILVQRAEFVPGRVGAAVRAAPAGLRRLRLLRQAHVRPRRLAAAAGRALAAAGADRAAACGSPRAGRSSTAPTGRGSAASRSPA